MKLKSFGILFVGLPLAVLQSSLAAIDSQALKIAGLTALDEAAPELTVKESDGRKLSLGDFHGQPILLHFCATWCGPCKQELPALAHLMENLKNTGPKFLFVSIDKEASQKEVDDFRQLAGLTVPIYLAREGSVSDRYSTWGIPVTYLIDDKRRVVARKLGPTDWNTPTIKNLLSSFNRPPGGPRH